MRRPLERSRSSHFLRRHLRREKNCGLLVRGAHQAAYRGRRGRDEGSGGERRAQQDRQLLQQRFKYISINA